MLGVIAVVYNVIGAGKCNPAPDNENDELPDPKKGAEYITSVSPGVTWIGTVSLYNKRLDGTRDNAMSDVASTGLPLESCSCMTKILLPAPFNVTVVMGAAYKAAWYGPIVLAVMLIDELWYPEAAASITALPGPLVVTGIIAKSEPVGIVTLGGTPIMPESLVFKLIVVGVDTGMPTPEELVIETPNTLTPLFPVGRLMANGVRLTLSSVAEYVDNFVCDDANPVEAAVITVVPLTSAPVNVAAAYSPPAGMVTEESIVPILVLEVVKVTVTWFTVTAGALPSISETNTL